MSESKRQGRVLDHELRSMPVEELVEHPENPRRGDVDAIATSIETNGFYGTVVVQRSTGFVLAGNHRLQAARRNGIAEVPVMIVDVDDSRAKKILLADNRTNDLATYDDDKLVAMLQEVDDLLGTGWDEAAVAELLAGGPKDGLADPDDVPDPPATPTTRVGDMWELGPHRVVCGDSRDTQVLERLGGGGSLLWTDPPYGVEYVGKTRAALTIANDDADGLDGLLRGVWAAVSGTLDQGAPFYVAAPAGPLWATVYGSIIGAGWRFHAGLVWVKDTMVLGHSDYHFRHENILYGWLPGEGRSGRGKHKGSRWFGDNAQTSVFEVARPKRSTEHPTMKPVELIETHVANSSRGGQTVIDPFLGSGSTLIACERRGRVCHGIDVEPAYVDVTVERWQQFTGGKAKRVKA